MTIMPAIKHGIQVQKYRCQKIKVPGNTGLMTHADFSTKMLNWYDKEARDLLWRVMPLDKRAGIVPDPYFVWLSEIMLQQTTVATVVKYFVDFTMRWPRVQDLAGAPVEDVLAGWAGLGYYRRAHNLHQCAKVVTEQWGGTFPQCAQDLMQLPGIGRYSGAAIAAICFDEAVAVIDGNVERVAARQLDLAVPPKQVIHQVRAWLQPHIPERSGDFAQSLMDLGATICTPKKPRCMICPVQTDCVSFQKGVQDLRPVRPGKKKRPEKQGHIFVVQNQQGEVWLRTRPLTGLLAQMPEFPSTDWVTHGGDFEPPFEAEWQMCGTITHIFTHFKLELKIYHTQIAHKQPFESGAWHPLSDASRRRLPTLFKKVWDWALADCSLDNE